MHSNLIVYPHQELFSKDYHSITRLSKITINGKKGPIGGTAKDINPKKALIKSVAESLDRRSSMLWFNNNSCTQAFDILEHKVVEVSKSFFALNDLETVQDTTGSAAHIISEAAVNNAILELLQKNALIDIWYNKNSERLVQNNVKFLVSTIFTPSIHILAMQEDVHRVFFSMGSGVTVEEARNNAIDELDVLRVQKSRFNQQYGEERDFEYSMDISGQKTYFLSLYNNSPQYIDNLESFSNKQSAHFKNQLLIDSLNSATKHAYIRLLPNERVDRFCVVRVVADNLINVVPYKKLMMKYPKQYLTGVSQSKILKSVDIPPI